MNTLITYIVNTLITYIVNTLITYIVNKIYCLVIISDIVLFFTMALSVSSHKQVFRDITIFYLQHLLTLSPAWSPPSLFSLPYQYEKVFQLYRKLICHKCKKVPREPALCLVCASLICFKEKCCAKDEVYECIRVRMALNVDFE